MAASWFLSARKVSLLSHQRKALHVDEIESSAIRPAFFDNASLGFQKGLRRCIGVLSGRAAS
jgi:hypothetical protein